MKTANQLIILFAVYAASAIPTNSLYSEGRSYPRYIDFPDGEGNMHKVDLEAEPDMEVLNDIERNPADNQYLLFTRYFCQTILWRMFMLLESKLICSVWIYRRNPNNPQSLVINDPASIANSNFNPNAPTVVVVHGWLSNQNTNPNPTIRDGKLSF